MNKLKKLYSEFDLSKSKKNEDGTLVVCGYASSGAVDSDGEIITPEAMKAAIPDYMKFGAVREMHGSVAAGTALNIEVQDDGRTYFECLVVDKESVKKCELGVFKGFSIGGKVKERDTLNKSIIKAINLIEISLVDRPANPEAKFECFKAETLEDDEQDLPEQETLSQEVEKTEVTPVEPVVETPAVDEVKKGLYDVARLAMIIDELKWLQDCFKDEAEWEQDNSPIPEEFKQIIISLNALLVKAVVEETQEVNDGLNEKEASDLTTDNKSIILNEDNVNKAGSRNSKTDAERIQKIHDLALELGAVSPSNVQAVKSEQVEDLAKAEEIKKSLNESLEKALKLEKENEELSKRVKELEDLPKPRKASITGITKSQDIGEEQEQNKVTPVLKSDGSVDETATLMKQALANKQVIRFQ